MRRFERGDQKQLRIGEVRVEEIPFDPKSRDDIPAILRGLKALTCDGESRDRLFELLERYLGEKRDYDLSRGLRGMELWSMGVLALLREGLIHLWWRPMSPTPRMYGYCGMPVAPLCV